MYLKSCELTDIFEPRVYLRSTCEEVLNNKTYIKHTLFTTW